MQFIRNVERSVAYALEAKFENPPFGFSTAFNVYGEDQFMDEDFVPTPPFVFLLGYRVRPRETRLPLLIVERVTMPHSLFEVGNREGHLPVFNIHVLARNPGERSDLAAFIEKDWDTITIYDFSGDSPVELETDVIVNRNVTAGQERPQDVAIEGALNNADTVTIAFQTRT